MKARRHGDIGNGFAEKWAKYENAWDLLEQTFAHGGFE
jgi:hypothetical protein